jgi:hypothetical protein
VTVTQAGSDSDSVGSEIMITVSVTVDRDSDFERDGSSGLQPGSLM